MVNKKTGERHPVRYSSPAFFVFHTINAYEDGAGNIVLDLAGYKNADIITDLLLENLEKCGLQMTEPPNVMRFVLPLKLDFVSGVRVFVLCLCVGVGGRVGLCVDGCLGMLLNVCVCV